MEVRVTPTKLLHVNEEDFFRIYGCRVHIDDEKHVVFNNYGNISIKGNIVELSLDKEYTMILKPDNGRYKGSYEIVSMEHERPETTADQKHFLEAILTEKQVENIYAVYSEDDDIVGMIQKDEFDYSKVKGIGDVMIVKLKEKITENIYMSEVLTFLSRYNIKYSMISRLVREYGDPKIVMEKIKKNPYVLTEIKGIGFKKADNIARLMGYSPKSEHRIDSCLIHCISEENTAGHSWVDKRKLLNMAVDLLNINKSYVEDQINNGVEGLVNIDGKYSRSSVYEAEKYISERIIEINKVKSKVFEREYIDSFLDKYSKEHGISLEEKQREFFHNWNENNLTLLIGSAGMGKSYLQKILLELIKEKDIGFVLLSPTGKSSKVQTNYTGHQAHTVHRRIGLGIHSKDDENTSKYLIEDRVVIVDEMSMCDIFMIKELLKSAVRRDVRVLFIGDNFQLASVGVGRVLHDLIESNMVSVTQLDKVFRQKESGMLDVITNIRQGTRFLNHSDSGRVAFGNNCVFWLTNQKFIKDGVIFNYKKALKNFSPEDMVVLTPTNKGELGTVALNKAIQEIVNPKSSDKKERSVGKKESPTIFRVGDVVMNLINTYDIETVDGRNANVFNGDTGIILDIDEDEGVVIIDYEGIVVKMKFGLLLAGLSHAWALTINKSQGSQYKVVILVIDKSSSFQLNSNLLYTGSSRASDYMLVLTQAETINRAIRKKSSENRRSFLKEMLESYKVT